MNKTLAITAVIAGLAAAASADPTYTNINNTSGEVSQAQLLGAVYGGTWIPLTGTLSYTNGTLTALRVADGGLASPIDILSGNPSISDDRMWSGPSTTVTARARYAADTHTFGWINDSVSPLGGGGGVFQPLLSTSTFNVPVVINLSPSFRWALKDLFTSQTVTSLPTNNPNSVDMMATYRIQGAPITSPTWLLVWEDRTSNSDRDFNDSAIELTAVPAPGAITLAGLGLTLVAGGRRRK